MRIHLNIICENITDHRYLVTETFLIWVSTENKAFVQSERNNTAHDQRLVCIVMTDNGTRSCPIRPSARSAR